VCSVGLLIEERTRRRKGREREREEEEEAFSIVFWCFLGFLVFGSL
jgi:hypothetical protein